MNDTVIEDVRGAGPTSIKPPDGAGHVTPGNPRGEGVQGVKTRVDPANDHIVQS